MREKLKSFLLVLLSLSAAALFGLNLLLALDNSRFARVRRTLGLTDERGASVVIADESAVLTPARLGVLGPGGLYLAAGTAADELLGETLPILSEALGSVSRIEAIRQQQFLDRLEGQGIYCSFTYPVPFFLLQYWWTGELGLADQQAASAMVLTVEDGRVELAFYDGAQERFYLAETAAGYQRLSALCARYDSPNAFFACQSDGWQMLPLWEPVWIGEVWYPSYAVTALDFTQEGAISKELLSAFSVNPYLAKVYKTTEGDVVYVEGRTALQFSRDGSVAYTSQDEQGLRLDLREGLSERELRAYAAARSRALLQDVCSAASTRMSLSVARSTVDERGVVTVAFEQAAGGAFVTGEDGYAAVVTVENGAVTGIRMRLLALTQLQDVKLLPYRLASSLLPEKCDGVFVRYGSGDGRLTPGLYVMKGGASRGME